MRSSVLLAVRDIAQSDDRIGNKDRREKFLTANMDITMEGSFNLGDTMKLDDTFASQN
jgi:hypothetical protein